MSTSAVANRNNFIRWNKVTGVYPEASLPSVGVPSATEQTNFWNVTLATLTNSESVTGELATVNDVTFGNNGLKMYVAGNRVATFEDVIAEYDLSTAWDTSTASFVHDTEITEDSAPTGIAFKDDGTKMYIVGTGNDDAYEFDLSTAWDVTSHTFVQSFDLTATDTNLTGITFNDDGTRMYIVGKGNNGDVYQFDLDTAWEISPNTSAGSFDLSTEDNNPEGVSFSTDGLLMSMVGAQNDTVYTYELSAAWDVTNMTQSKELDIESEINICRGIFFRPNGYRFFIADAQNFAVGQFDIPEDLFPTPTGNQTQYDDIENYAVTLFAGERVNFYANLDTLEDSATFTSWRLDIVNTDFITQAYGVATLSKDIISGSDYRFYLNNWEVVDYLNKGCYRFVIIDTTDNTVKYISNVWNYSSTISYFTKRIRYRNPEDILNFDYENLPSYRNRFRINLVQRQPSYSTARTGYTLIDGSFNPVRTTTGMEFDFITENYNELDHEAWNAATIHELEVFNEKTGQWEVFKRSEDAAYEVDWQDNYPFADGTIKLEQENTYNSSKNV